MMEREWPHQVALPAYRCHGHNYVTLRLFCEPVTCRGDLFQRLGHFQQ
jgi:hypothetical protein